MLFLSDLLEFLIKYSMKNLEYNVAIVGATGLIGRKFIEVLEQRQFPIANARLFASERSRGKTLQAFGRTISVESLESNDFDGIDFAFFSAGKEVSLKYAPLFEKSGAIVIDNSSAFRGCLDIPLIVPELNGDKIYSSDRKIIANPNCSTIIAITPLCNIRKNYKIKRLIFSTYQSVSGSGMKGVKDLLKTRHGFSGSYYPFNVANTIIPEIGEILENGYTDEEMKMVHETRKILESDIRISATCVRVPTENCHGVTVEAETDEKIEVEEVKNLMKFKGVKLSETPNFEEADGKDDIFVGRIRKSRVFDRGFSYFAVGDNTRKGASLNAVEIAEFLASAT